MLTICQCPWQCMRYWSIASYPPNLIKEASEQIIQLIIFRNVELHSKVDVCYTRFHARRANRSFSQSCSETLNSTSWMTYGHSFLSLVQFSFRATQIFRKLWFEIQDFLINTLKTLNEPSLTETGPELSIKRGFFLTSLLPIHTLQWKAQGKCLP